MDKPKIETITIEAAVARMIHLDYLPPDENPYDLYDYLEILCDYAEERYKSARGKTSEEHLRTLELLWIACRERLKFASSLHQALEQAVKFPDHPKIEVVDHKDGRPLLSVKKVFFWANLRFRTNITDWKTVQTSARKTTKWEDCLIKIYRDYKIGLFKGTGDYSKHSFQKFELMGKRKHKPNKLGNILIWLSLKQPTSTFPKGITRKDISKLRDALRKLTGLSGNPFYPVIEKDNYMPRFKIIDDTLNADKRAKLSATNVEYDDQLSHDDVIDFEDEFHKTLSFNKKTE